MTRHGPKGAWRHTELEVLQTIKRLGAACVYKISSELKLDDRWINQKLAFLKDAGRIYVEDHYRNHQFGPWIRIFALRTEGQEDVPPPKAKSGSQKTQEYRRRKRLAKQLNLLQPRCQSQVEHPSQTSSHSTSS